MHWRGSENTLVVLVEYISGAGRIYWWGRENIFVGQGEYIGGPRKIY